MTEGQAVLALGLAVPGACCGSFIATAVVRGAHGEQALEGRSRCDQCSAPLAFHQTVPLVSYVLTGGVCANCQGRIDWLHPLGEAVGALLAGSVGFAPDATSGGWLTRGLLGLLGFALLALGLSDLRTLRLPDGLVATAAAVSAALAWRSGGLRIGLLAAALSFVLLEGLRRGFIGLRSKPGLGFGDVKLLTALALWLGPRTPLALALACVLALIARFATKSLAGRAAFGPAIVFAAWIVGLSSGRPLWP